jgi:hypothetical protein
MMKVFIPTSSVYNIVEAHMDTKNTLIAIVVLLLLGAGVYFASGKKTEAPAGQTPTGDNKEIIVKGVLVPGGVECQRLQTLDGTYYTISRSNLTTQIKEGDQVEVTGTPAEVSFCQQDITLNVTKIVKLGSSAGDPNNSQNFSIKSNNSGINGAVTYGPVCAVMPEPDEGQCSDKPYAATIIIRSTAGVDLTKVKSDENGVFQITLAPGDYVLHPVTEGQYPTAGDVPVTVEANKFAKVLIQYDSGIR